MAGRTCHLCKGPLEWWRPPQTLYCLKCRHEMNLSQSREKKTRDKKKRKKNGGNVW